MLDFDRLKQNAPKSPVALSGLSLRMARRSRPEIVKAAIVARDSQWQPVSGAGAALHAPKPSSTPPSLLAPPDPVAGALRFPSPSGSALCDRVFRENLLDPFERLVRGGLRRYPVLHDCDPRAGEDTLVLDISIGRVIDPEIRHGRAEQALLDIKPPVRVLGVAPPRVILHDREHRRQVAAKPRFQQLVDDLR